MLLPLPPRYWDHRLAPPCSVLLSLCGAGWSCSCKLGQYFYQLSHICSWQQPTPSFCIIDGVLLCSLGYLRTACILWLQGQNPTPALSPFFKVSPSQILACDEAGKRFALRLLTARPVAVTAKSKPSKKQQIHLFLGYRLPIDDTFLQWGHRAKVRSVNSVHRNVFLQCPQMTLTPIGCGSGLRGPGCTGPRLMILLLYRGKSMFLKFLVLFGSDDTLHPST